MSYPLIFNATSNISLDSLLARSNDAAEHHGGLAGLCFNTITAEASTNINAGLDFSCQSLRITPESNSKSNYIPHADRLVDIKEVCMLTKLCRTSVYDKQNRNHKNYDPTFPKRRTSKSLGRRARCSYNEIMKWVNELT